jgi:hypothetical protein
MSGLHKKGRTTGRPPARSKKTAAKKPAKRARVVRAEAVDSASKRITAKEQREIERKAKQLEERIRLSTKACEMYAAHRVTIESACESAGIAYETLWAWRRQHAEIKEIFENAENEHRMLWFEGLKEKALNSFELLVAGSEHEEVATTGVPEVDKDGKVILSKDGKPTSIIPTEIKTTRKKVLPHAGMVAMAMRNFHGLRDAIDVQHGGSIGVKQVFEIGGQKIEF